jgi:hypothetical protein
MKGGMNIQLWDNGDFYCEKANLQRDWVTDTTTWTYTCPAAGGDYFMVFTNNGREGYVERRFTDGKSARQSLLLPAAFQ